MRAVATPWVLWYRNCLQPDLALALPVKEHSARIATSLGSSLHATSHLPSHSEGLD